MLFTVFCRISNILKNHAFWQTIRIWFEDNFTFLGPCSRASANATAYDRRVTKISRIEEMSTYQNVDIGGAEAKCWKILNEKTALELKTQSGQALQASDELQQCAQQNSWQIKPAGNQKVGTNTISPNIPPKN